MGTLHYLAYGSNLHPLRLAERAPSARLLGTATLPGCRLAFHKRGRDGSAKCDLLVTEDPTDVAFGAVYAMDETDKPLLDLAEGEGRGYRTALMRVELAETSCHCFVYRADAGHVEAKLRPFHWYKELVALGAEYLGLPRGYVESIRGVPSAEDPDPARRNENRRRARLLRRANRPR